ncbi:hypothetical protein J6590_018891 [Homalodisca vitripennis]|nr:hypothetical protein J6590_018891 [Homalodisca vitripennis]
MLLLRFGGKGVRVGAGVGEVSVRRPVRRVNLMLCGVICRTLMGQRKMKAMTVTQNNRNMKKNPKTKPRYLMKKEVTPILDPNQCLVASYIPKKGGNVLVGSTMHKKVLLMKNLVTSLSQN